MRIIVRLIRLAQYALTVAGIAAVGYCAAIWFGAARFQASQARRFDGELEAHAARFARTSVSRPPFIAEEGEPIGKLEIPRLGLSVIVVEGVGHRDLDRAVGHVPGTAFPWQAGNIGIAGHRDTFFRPLRFIRPNDVITLSTLEGSYHYRVVATEVVSPSDVQVLQPAGADTLTLVTCFPFYYVGSAPKRFIVRAEHGS